MGRFETIRALLAGHAGGARRFVKTLDDRGLAHLSWSKVSCVESCPYGYYLQYVKRVRLVPEPDYFVKGRLFHAAADRFYRGLQRGRALGAAELESIVGRHKCAVARAHLRNAVTVLLGNAFTEWEVLGIEQIIALDLGPGLPPCVGVIDLVLRKGKVFAVVDHKTGKAFWRQDPMQLAIYREHVLREHGPVRVSAFVDAYRWVNDLRRIRKPAHQRTRVRLSARSWGAAMRRFTKGYAAIQGVERAGEDSPATGACYMCAWRGVCKKAASTSWW
jgi:predicted RecB family nuclease